MAINNSKHTLGQQISASLAVSCFIAVTQLITKNELSTSLQWSVVFFSIALPLLIAITLVKAKDDPILIKTVVASWLLSEAGFICIFYSFHWFAGVLFFIFSIVGYNLFKKHNAM